MHKRLIAAILTGALFAATPLTASDDEPAPNAGLMQAATPVCPTPEQARRLWEVLLEGRFQLALDWANDGDCFLAEGNDYYTNGRYTDDEVIQVDIVYHGGKAYTDWWTLPGGLRCAVDCPPGAVLYHD